MGFWFLPFPVVRTCGVRLSHVVYSGVSWSRDDSAYCGAPLTLRKCGNAGMRRRKEEKLGSYSSDTIDLKKLFFFRQDISLAWNFLIWLCQPASESQRSICLHLSTAGVAAHTTKPDFFLFFTWALGIKPRSLWQALHLLSHPPAPWLGLFRGLTVARLISKLTQEESTFIQIQQYWPWIDIDWHMEKAQGILSTDPRRGQSILPSFLALFFIRGLERVAARGRKPFETWSSSNWDKLKEMLLCRVESDLRECYIPKAKGWEYTQIKNTSDILINYVYENNPNGRQYGNS